MHVKQDLHNESVQLMEIRLIIDRNAEHAEQILEGIWPYVTVGSDYLNPQLGELLHQCALR